MSKSTFLRSASIAMLIAGQLPIVGAVNAAPGNSSVAKTPATKPVAAQDPLPARGGYLLTGNAQSLGVFGVGVDAQELFTAIADRAGLMLVVDDTVSRKLTVNIQAKPALQVVADIVSAYGLSSANVDGVTYISEGIPRSPSSYLLSDISSIPTKYVDAANARNLLPVFLQDYVKVNSEQNAVVLSAPTGVLDKFRDDIAQFDKPGSQIQVDLLLVELENTSADQLDLGLTYQNAGQGPSVDPATGNVQWNAVTDLPNQFAANLQALVQKGKARVRADPRIATVSGRAATIFDGIQQYIATPIDLGDNQGQTNNFSAGVKLQITPYTGGEGQVLISVDAEVSTLSAPDPKTGLPQKDTRTVTTTVRVNNNQTAVIGGLTEQEERDVHSRIPILADIPLVGNLFKSHNDTWDNTELVLFITPHVLSDTGHLPQKEENALKSEFLGSDLNKPLVRPDLLMPTAQPSPGAAK